eukprot:6621977-Prymnesium_polylepis.1
MRTGGSGPCEAAALRSLCCMPTAAASESSVAFATSAAAALRAPCVPGASSAVPPSLTASVGGAAALPSARTSSMSTVASTSSANRSYSPPALRPAAAGAPHLLNPCT